MKFIVGVDGQGFRAKNRGLVPEVGEPGGAGFDWYGNQVGLGIVEYETIDLK